MSERLDLWSANLTGDGVPISFEFRFRFPPQIGVHLLFRVGSAGVRSSFRVRFEFDPGGGGSLRSPDEFIELALEMRRQRWRRWTGKVALAGGSRTQCRRVRALCCLCAHPRSKGGGWR